MKEPGTVVVALSCVALSAVPYVMSAGFAQVMTGVVFVVVTVRRKSLLPVFHSSGEGA